MTLPGAYVVGHHAVVRGKPGATGAVCACGFASQVASSMEASCLALVGHLRAVVRQGAQVAYGGPGPAGVREPHRPLPPGPGPLTAAADHPRTA